MIHSKADLLSEGAHRKKHADMVSSSHFRAFVALALIEYAGEQSKRADDPGTAHRLQGAFQLVDKLMHLSNLPTLKAGRDPDNLPPE